jgi:hypothetical protein
VYRRALVRARRLQSPLEHQAAGAPLLGWVESNRFVEKP